jgi:septal ring factor EnvC (AmiA/AmiB activator)
VSAGNFGAQRGRLPSPLSHTHVVARRFGVQRHATLSKIEVDNPGVDLETSLAATARAIYPGVVSAVFVQDGYEHVVLIRHGDYLTVYANIKNLSVKKGDNVRAGTIIGTLGPSDSNPSRGLLHFEIRREREKFDPLLWLKK